MTFGEKNGKQQTLSNKIGHNRLRKVQSTATKNLECGARKQIEICRESAVREIVHDLETILLQRAQKRVLLEYSTVC